MKNLRILSFAALSALAAASSAVVFSYSGLTSTGASTNGTFASGLLTVDGAGEEGGAGGHKRTVGRSVPRPQGFPRKGAERRER